MKWPNRWIFYNFVCFSATRYPTELVESHLLGGQSMFASIVIGAEIDCWNIPGHKKAARDFSAGGFFCGRELLLLFEHSLCGGEARDGDAER